MLLNTKNHQTNQRENSSDKYFPVGKKAQDYFFELLVLIQVTGQYLNSDIFVLVLEHPFHRLSQILPWMILVVTSFQIYQTLVTKTVVWCEQIPRAELLDHILILLILPKMLILLEPCLLFYQKCTVMQSGEKVGQKI